MPRGMFTQCFSVLTKEPVSLDAVETALEAFPLLARYEAAEHWATRGPSISIAFRPEVNGIVLVDVVDQPWPDDMGDVQNESPLSNSWMMGHFGPLTAPGSLQRAAQQCWGWKEGRTVPEEQHGFVRVRISYVIGSEEDAPPTPKDWDAATEMLYLTKIVEALLKLPEALCFFNPNGEILRDAETLQIQIEQAQADEVIAIDAWMNVRLYPFDEEWVLMDTVGNGQLNDKSDPAGLKDLPDVEAIFRNEVYDFADVDGFLRDLTLYLYGEGNVIQEGDLIEGPNDVPWKASLEPKSVAMPMRPVIRVSPQDGVAPPQKPA